MLLGIMSDVISYIKNGLPHITFGGFLFACGCLAATAKGIEDLFGKKYIGTWFWNGVKRVIMMPATILKMIEDMRRELATIKHEVTYNGGKYKLRDAVADLKVTCDTMAVMLRDVNLSLKVSDEIDNMMKFRTDASGYLLSPNRAYLDYFGFKETDVRGFNWENCIHRKYLQEVQVKWKRATQTKSDFIDTYIIIDSEGKEHRCLVRAIAMMSNDELHGYYGTIEPIEK